MAEIYLVEAVIMGVLIGLIELFFVHADEKGLGWMSHGLHTLPTAFIFTFVAMNIPWTASLVEITVRESPVILISIQVVIGILAAFKVRGAAAIVSGKNAVGETMVHALIIGALIAASPYIWALVEPVMPGFITNINIVG